MVKRRELHLNCHPISKLLHYANWRALIHDRFNRPFTRRIFSGNRARTYDTPTTSYQPTITTRLPRPLGVFEYELKENATEKDQRQLSFVRYLHFVQKP
ncbi:hypothetical protein TNCV_1493681 [Trichonephila clavipes]|nr:hypothetical protein TNCV_1493681 [Trichonephila clavipes]